MRQTNTSIGILGAGITGLTAGYALAEMGCEIAIYEQSGRPGGLIQTTRQDGWLVEHGPNTLLIKEQKIWDLFDKLGLNNSVTEAPRQAKKRYIVKDGQLRAVPSSLSTFLKTPLLSASAKLRLLKEPFVKASQDKDESIASFIRRRLGNEVLDYAVDPFISGIYAGNTDALSIRNTFPLLHKWEKEYGSIFKGIIKNKRDKKPVKKSLLSFEQGIQQLPLALAEKLESRLKFMHTVISLQPGKSGWTVQTQSPAGNNEYAHSVIISTLPLHALNHIQLPDTAKRAARQLSTVRYAPVAAVALGFKKEQVQHPLDGFGMLIPKTESFKTLGTLFSSTLFPNRAPRGHLLLTSFTGGARQPGLIKNSDQQITAAVLDEISSLLDISEGPVFQKLIKWQQAIPQYETGYQTYINCMRDIENIHPGLLLAGSYRKGVSVPDCILNGFETAKRATSLV